MDEIADSGEWEYRAEGNFHVVVVNHRTKQVLRLPKCCRDEKAFDDLSSMEAAASELAFVRHVAHPAMRNCKACYPIQQVPLGREFLRNVSKKVELQRPSYRLHKVIDEDCKFGILMPDFCQVLPSPPFSGGATISVEIKPKQGFILNGHKRCKFSQFQHLKVHSKAYEKESTYCPVDLFSGCKKRMQRAIKSLIKHPQNNLRVFRNGKVIYSQECLDDDKSAKPKDIFKSNVLSVLASHVGNKLETMERLKAASHNLQDILCNLLLFPVCENKPHRTHVPQHCSETSIQDSEVKEQSVNEQTDDPNANTNKPGGKRSHEPRLSSDCILSLLLSLQKLEDRPISDYYEMYKLMKNHLDTFPEDEDKLSLEGPYDADPWTGVVSEICGEKNLLDDDGRDDSWREDVEKAASLLRKFLIATSFKDCSIMMTFQLKPQTVAISTCDDCPISIKTRYGQEYWASLALVDSDPKPACRIPQYYHDASKHT